LRSPAGRQGWAWRWSANSAVAGAAIAFVARGQERVERVAREIPGTHGIIGDLTRKEDIHPVALQITGSLGGLDVLVNNASSLGPVPLALLADTECEQLELVLATNLVGPFRLTRALLGALSASTRQGRGAVILNITSDVAINPTRNGAPTAPARPLSST
jgi:NAD(P)-dependent dehydrogenase (short-subunit alcohol dehydrogenase family)